MMPVPRQAEFGEGVLPIEPGFSVSGEGYWEPRLTRAVERMLTQLGLRTGLPLRRAGELQPERPVLTIRCEGPGDSGQPHGSDESYTLVVSKRQARRGPLPLIPVEPIRDRRLLAPADTGPIVEVPASPGNHASDHAIM